MNHTKDRPFAEAGMSNVKRKLLASKLCRNVLFRHRRTVAHYGQDAMVVEIYLSMRAITSIPICKNRCSMSSGTQFSRIRPS